MLQENEKVNKGGGKHGIQNIRNPKRIPKRMQKSSPTKETDPETERAPSPQQFWIKECIKIKNHTLYKSERQRKHYTVGP